MTTYERYIATIEEDMPQYVVDCEGNLHDLSGNVQTKLESVDKSKRYWEIKLRDNPEDNTANRFYNKFKLLYEQINIFLENTNLVAQV